MTRSQVMFIVFAAAILLIAAALRLPELSARPFHGDEAVNAAKFRELWESGSYRYDPHEYHGPTLPYATLPFVPLGADSYAETVEADYRLVTVFFGVLLVALTLCAAPGIGYAAALIAALLTALSTAMVFYSRYYIHEMPLVVFTFAAILCGWRYTLRPSIGWAVGCGAALALMHATKETAVLAWFAMGVGAVCTAALHGRGANGPRIAWLRPAPIALGIATYIAVYILLFSSFFTNGPGLIDGVRTFLLYADRGTAGDSSHAKPWHWYLGILLLYRDSARAPWFSEAVVFLLSLVGVVAAIHRRYITASHLALVRFLAIYTFTLTALYAVVSYKTPWCLLSFLHGMALLAGVGAVFLVRVTPTVVGRVVLVALLAAATGRLSYQMYRANFDPRLLTHRANPYVYAHPGSTIREIGQRVEELAAAAGPGMTVLVLEEENLWPLPFYLRRVERVGYPKTFEQLPTEARAAVLIVLPERGPQVAARYGDHYAGPYYYGIRPQVLVAMYVRADLWERFLNERETPARRPPEQ